MISARRILLLAVLAFLPALGAGKAAVTGTISAHPNPCEIAPGAHDCTTYLTWSTQGAKHARVYVKAEGAKGSTPEKEFGTGPACAKCGASWIEAGNTYVFTLVDFTEGTRGAVLGTVTVTAVPGKGAPMAREAGTITATPNPCRVAPGKADCTTRLKWETSGAEHARVYVTMEGKNAGPEKEFGTGKAGEQNAPWIEPGTRYKFTLYDWTTGSRGRALASVDVTATK